MIFFYVKSEIKFSSRNILESPQMKTFRWIKVKYTGVGMGENIIHITHPPLVKHHLKTVVMIGGRFSTLTLISFGKVK
jgi:hypothetical protein